MRSSLSAGSRRLGSPPTRCSWERRRAERPALSLSATAATGLSAPRKPSRRPSGPSPLHAAVTGSLWWITWSWSATAGTARRSLGDCDLVSASLTCAVVPSLHDHWCHQEPSRQGLGRLLVGWHLQPAGGHRADHVPPLPATSRRYAGTAGEQGGPAKATRRAPHLPRGEGRTGASVRGHALVPLPPFLR